MLTKHARQQAILRLVRDHYVSTQAEVLDVAGHRGLVDGNPVDPELVDEPGLRADVVVAHETENCPLPSVFGEHDRKNMPYSAYSCNTPAGQKTGGSKLLRAMGDAGFNFSDFPPPAPDLSLPTAAPGPLCAQVSVGRRSGWRHLFKEQTSYPNAAAQIRVFGSASRVPFPARKGAAKLHGSGDCRADWPLQQMEL